MNERTRSMYYVEGSAVRKVEGVPERFVRPERERQIEPKRHLTKAADRALAFDLKYTVFVIASVCIMVAACVTMLLMESRVNQQKTNINALEAQLEDMQADNAAYKSNIDSMYTLDQIYDIATGELGMVYARSGQIIYYQSADEDYVEQYQNIPEAK